jgi:hypothetical protein
MPRDLTGISGEEAPVDPFGKWRRRSPTPSGISSFRRRLPRKPIKIIGAIRRVEYIRKLNAKAWQFGPRVRRPYASVIHVPGLATLYWHLGWTTAHYALNSTFIQFRLGSNFYSS